MRYLYLEIEKCDECPYCVETDYEYDDSTISYFCHHPSYKARVQIGDEIIIQEPCPKICPLGTVVR